jgi:3-methyladenine DNA glycosylase Tag
MLARHAPKRPRDLAGYLEAISRAVFSAGISWRVVEAKWEGIGEAFAGFDPERVAELDSRDIDALMSDQRVIRNRGKLEGTVDNAQTILELNSEFGSFRRYLRSHGDYDSTVADLKRQFRFLGDSGAYFFLWSVGEPVPDHEEWAAARSARSKGRSRSRATSRR